MLVCQRCWSGCKDEPDLEGDVPSRVHRGNSGQEWAVWRWSLFGYLQFTIVVGVPSCERMLSRSFRRGRARATCLVTCPK